MSNALPGQRAAQRPMQAAMASQRALGRAAGPSGVVTDLMIINVDGLFMRVVNNPDGSQDLEPYDIDQTEE